MRRARTANIVTAAGRWRPAGLDNARLQRSAVSQCAVSTSPRQRAVSGPSSMRWTCSIRRSTILSSTPRRRRWSRKLTAALQQYAATPSDAVRCAQRRIAAAKRPRQRAERRDPDRAAGRASRRTRTSRNSVTRLNTLLAQFETVNTAIVKGTRSGADVTDQLDARDRVLAGLAEEVGISTVSRADGDMAVYTDSGVTLFEGTARTVTFQATSELRAGRTGQCRLHRRRAASSAPRQHARRNRAAWSAWRRSAMTSPSPISPSSTKSRAGSIEAFAESDQSAMPTLPDVPGLFTYPGAPADAGNRHACRRAGRLDPRRASVDPGAGRQPQSAARWRDRRQSGLRLQRLRRTGVLRPPAGAARRHERGAAVRSRSASRAQAERLPASPPRRWPGCRRRAARRMRTPNIERHCWSGRPRRCPRSTGSISTRK